MDLALKLQFLYIVLVLNKYKNDGEQNEDKDEFWQLACLSNQSD